MLGRWQWIAALLTTAAVAVLVWAFNPTPTDTAPRFEPDLTFATADGEELKLDLALPPGDGPFPAVVCLHAGGWVGGDRKQLTRTLGVLSRRGYVAIAPDYRLAPKHRFPACLEDCKAAVRWLRANAAKYRIDPERIGATGPSAGGHLACLLAVTTPDDGLEGRSVPGQRSDVQAVAAFSAPADLTSPAVWTPEALTRNLVPLLGGTPKEVPEAYRRASPMSYTPKAAPPMLLVHGSEDRVVPLSQATELARKINRAGGSARLVVLQGEGHTWNGVNLLRGIDEMLSFLDEVLRKPAA